MRKDVKIGLGIGGVLLAVLIVYLLVPKTNDASEFVRNGESSAERGDGAVSPATEGSQGVSSDQGTGSTASNGTSADPVRDAAAQAPYSGTTPSTGTPVIDGERDAGSPTPPKIDWDSVLANGIVPDDARVGLLAPNAPPEDIFADKTPAKTGASDVVDYRGAGGAPVTPATPTPPPTPSQTPAANGGSTNTSKASISEHVVQQGENLSMIASVAYGDARLYREILKANPTLDERRLKPGTVLKMPNPSTFATAKTPSTGAQQAVARQEAALDSTREYRVAQGDSLHKIAVKLWGKAGKADNLYELNKDKIGDDSSRLKLGMVLKLPEPPAAATSAR